MRRFLIALAAVVCLSALGWGRVRQSGWCEQGAQTVTINAQNATPKFQRGYASATVSVFDTGTTNLSTIYSDNIGTAKANPFTADSTGAWFFYADNARYDVQCVSGGTTLSYGDFSLLDPVTFLSSNQTIGGVWTFSGNNIFSGANTLSGGNTFSGTNTFSGANTFSAGNTFSGANTFSGNNTFSGTNTVSILNGTVAACQQTGADVGAKINTALGLLPAAGGTVFVDRSCAGTFATAISITASARLIFDSGVFTYSGAGTAVTCSSANGVDIEGSGNANGQPAGATASAGTQIVASNTGALGMDISSCPGIVVRNLTLLGPNSGTGIGLKVTANSGHIEDVNVRAWGSDGVNVNGTRGNSNLLKFTRVTSVSNKGWGFNVAGANANLITFDHTSGSTNTLGNYQIATADNVFLGAHSEASVTLTGYSFISGGSGNWGDLYSEVGNETTAVSLASGANNNRFYLSSQTAFSNSGTNNALYPLSKIDNSAGTSAAPSYTFIGSTTTGLWDASNAIGMSANGTDIGLLSSTSLRLGSGGIFGWSSAAGASGASNDTGLSRDAAGVVDVGTGAAGSVAGTIKATNFTFGATGGHMNQNASTSDMAGIISVSTSTTGSHSFATAYTNAPTCVITPTTNPGATTYWVTSSTTAVTANLSGSTTLQFTYVCVGAPN